MSLDAACEHVQKMVELARRENPEVIVLAHGGPISSAEDTRYLYQHTDAQGFLGASSMERIPVESAIIEAVHAFKSKRPRAAQLPELELAAGSR
jgi:predicted TIM-barrel enzyme